MVIFGMPMLVSQAVKKLGILLIVIGLMLGQAIIGLKLGRFDSVSSESPDQNAYKMHPRLYSALLFGQLSAGVDWLWIRTMIDSEIKHVQPGKHPHFFYNLDLATDLDPAFFMGYTVGASVLSVIRNDAIDAKTLLEKGENFVKHELPNYPPLFAETEWGSAWSIFMLKAYVLLFDLDNLALAADSFREAAKLPGAPSYALSLGERLSKPGGEYQVGMTLLNFMIGAAKDERVKKELEAKRSSLFLSQYLYQLTDSFRGFLKQQPEYKNSTDFGVEKIRKYWNRYKREASVPNADPWGGIIRIDDSGRVISSTPRQKVFGLE
jgi:hypothetical protein